MKKAVILFLSIIITQPINSMLNDSSDMQKKAEKRHIKTMRSLPYEKKETISVFNYGATTTTGIVLLCAGCALHNQPLTGIGFALLVGGSQDWQEYDLHKRNHYIRKP